jgi:hypothetical protein
MLGTLVCRGEYGVVRLHPSFRQSDALFRADMLEGWIDDLLRERHQISVMRSPPDMRTHAQAEADRRKVRLPNTIPVLVEDFDAIKAVVRIAWMACWHGDWRPPVEDREKIRLLDQILHPDEMLRERLRQHRETNP